MFLVVHVFQGFGSDIEEAVTFFENSLEIDRHDDRAAIDFSTGHVADQDPDHTSNEQKTSFQDYCSDRVQAAAQLRCEDPQECGE